MKNNRFILGMILILATWATTAMAATEQQKLDAINNGLANLYATRQIYQQQGYDWVYWNYGGYEPAATGAVVLAFMSQKDKWGANAANYQTAVDKAMNYLLNVAATFTVGDPYVRDDGNNPCGSNSTCLGVYWPAANNEITYTTGLIAPAMALYAAGHANEVAITSGPLANLTWGEIAQGITNMFALIQSTANSGNKRGGWRYYYYYPGPGDSDSSTTQWAIISMIYNQTLGATTPQFVKDELKYWLAAVQYINTDPNDPNHIYNGVACYQPGVQPCDHSDTGGLLLGLKFVGYDLSNSQVQAALSFLNTNWAQDANNTWYGNFGHPYAMWSVYKGLEVTIGLDDTTHITSFLTTCGGPGNLPGSGICNWWEDYNEWLVTNQNLDGSWSGYVYWTGPLATAFNISILGATSIPTDIIPPVLTLPDNIAVEATAASGTTVTYTASATDDVDGPITPICTPASGGTFPVGTTPVNCSATDQAGNTASGSFTVTVVDTTPPTITVPGTITAEATGPNGATVTYTASATDLVDGSVPVNCTPASGSTFALGATPVSCAAQDKAGNTATGGFTVTVRDTTPPVLNLPAAITVTATGPAGAAVNYSAAATDLVNGALTPTCTPASGSTFPIGTTPVNCAVTDQAGNTVTGSFTVTVVGTTPPSTTLFSAFSVDKLGIDQRHKTFALFSKFTLGTSSNGIDPVKEPVTLTLANFTTTIPAGSFRKGHFGVYAFAGKINNVWIEALIAPLGGNRFGFQAAAYGANLSGTTNPVTVKLTIGNDSGTTSVNAIIR